MHPSSVPVRPLTGIPDLTALHESDPVRYPFLLRSVARGSSPARFDILFAFPGEVMELDGDWNLRGPAAHLHAGFLASFDSWYREPLSGPVAEHPVLPFVGGWFLYLGYELAAEIEPGLPRVAVPDLPVARAVRIPAAVIHDHVEGQSLLVCEPGREALLEAMEDDVRMLDGSQQGAGDEPLVADLREEPAERFLAAVERAREYIRAGDIFQANLSRVWHGRLRPGVTPVRLWRQLCRANPAPYAGLARFGETAVVSSSPERLVRVRKGCIETRPIAGTRPRMNPVAEEAEQRLALVTHPKERAEHVMLIDLERNDLGRICAPGSVEVDQFMVVESYAHVHHIVSNIRGRLHGDAGPAAIVRAVFPGGTITGCPKVRCMEIIQELEQRPRGAYTGSMGYVSRDGQSDLNILIRSIVTRGDRFEFAAGSGIVADSVATTELEETRAKARGLLLALAG